MGIAETDSGKLEILYVDDESYLHEPFKLYVEMLGNASVDTAASATEAILKLSEREYSAVVSDYQMPSMDGIELLKHIRSEGNDIPFVIFTGRSREEVAIEAINSGADYYLMKGQDPKSLFTDMLHVITSAVTERMEREKLRVINQRLEAVLNNTHDAVVLLDLNYNVLYANPSFEKTFGWTLDEIRGMRIPWVPPELLNWTEEKINEMVSNKKPVNYQSRRITKDGRSLKCHISIAPITDPDGRVNTVSSIMTPDKFDEN
ncbi:MAG: response regulator [Candidatus Thermoplasmatota archaeon]|jgi:PAS domain S-box-containing protein|nr:response regulator [Candidatus Thermoplasmatota archaeon]